jgi:hypothetical protein
MKIFLTKAATMAPPRNFALTLLRTFSNAFATPVLVQRILVSGKLRDDLTGFLVANLLNEDASVRTAAASLAFNVAASLQARRVKKVQDGEISTSFGDEDGDWEVELVSVIVEAIEREQSEEVGKFGRYLRCGFDVLIDFGVSSSVGGMSRVSVAIVARL